MDRDSLTKGAAIIAFLFALGMLCLLYFIWSERFGWALFWWMFIAIAVPISIVVVYAQVKVAYTGRPVPELVLYLWITGIVILTIVAALTG